MSDFREELIEAMAAAQLARDGMADGFDADALPWDAAGEHLQGIYRESARVGLDAALAFRQTVECPECGGTGEDPTAVALEKLSAVLDLRCYACRATGRVPGETRLAIVTPSSWSLSTAFVLAPDLPEGTPEP